MNGIYTDLAAELRELSPDIEGVVEQTETDGEIEIKRIGILDAKAARLIGKAMGRYVTLDARALTARPLDLFEAVETRLSTELLKLMRLDIKNCTALIVGLGNRGVTPDSLGPRVVENILVTRHVKQFVPEAFDFELPGICAIAPGVLGVTGVETMDIVKGVVERVRPDRIIAIDALASRRAARISTTVQLTDAGISPGSGVGNQRAELSLESLGVPVIAIGVPLVVRAATITRDTLSLMANETGLHADEEKLKLLAESVTEKQLDDMIVTPKDIDAIVADMARIIANAINSAMFGGDLERVRSLIA
ncbi:MAG: GPR endopeptidase [Clostridia bacterium]|nr:GPR endopeptidase [Clostridia bacterium]